MTDQPTTARCEAVRAWAYNLLMERPQGLVVGVSVEAVSVLVTGEAEYARITVDSGKDDDTGPFAPTLRPDELAEGAGLLLGAADALQALSVLADAERAPTTIRED